MNEHRTIDTTDIELAAAHATRTGTLPPVCFHPDESLGVFELPDNAETHALFIEYATGVLTLNIKRFCSCRALLFRKLKEARR